MQSHCVQNPLVEQRLFQLQSKLRSFGSLTRRGQTDSESGINVTDTSTSRNEKTARLAALLNEALSALNRISINGSLYAAEREDGEKEDMAELHSSQCVTPQHLHQDCITLRV